MAYNPKNHFRTGGNSEAMRNQFNAVIADLLELRTELTALRVDYTAGRAEVVKLVTDLTATRAEVVKNVVDIGLVRDELILELDDIEALRTGDGLLTTPNVAVGTSSATEIKHDAFEVRHNGVAQIIAADEINLDSGTADDIPSHATDIERTFILQVSPAGTVTVGTGALGTVGNSAVPATDAGSVRMGVIVVQAPVSGAQFEADVDNLNTGQDSVDAVSFTSDAIEAPTASDPAAITASTPGAITAANPAGLTANAPDAATALALTS